MKIYELRKIASNNKKHKYVYQLIIDGKVFSTRRSEKEYVGCLVDDKAHHFFLEIEMAPLFINTPRLLNIDPPSAIALTFDGLLKYIEL